MRHLLLAVGLSDEVATKATQMGAAMRDGRMWEDYPNHKPVLGKIKLEDFALEFAKAF